MQEVYSISDFTESHYRKLLNQAKKQWSFISFVNWQVEGMTCLWRHDIDASVHRACRLAQIEAEEGVSATYFVHLHSEFYHVMERGIVEKLKGISALGHEIGLHFEPDFYNLQPNDRVGFEHYLRFEKRLLEGLLGVEIHAMSFHNPDIGNWHLLDFNEVAGLVNAYGPHFRENIAYCSDSNGYWRFERLADFLKKTNNKKIQVLTHPEWWVPAPMAPRERISRCIDGRAAASHLSYDGFFAMHPDRLNIR